jgi:hypothetical protein
VQIVFLTLFLGLTSGSVPVALSAGSEVASIEIVLDGVVAARLAGPPWETVLNLGADLLPHRLVARGLGLDGREVAQAVQWINVPRPAAEVEIVLEPAADGRSRVARLAWQSLTNDRPAAISLTLDGEPLQLDGENRATLPRPSATSSTRVLSAAVRFANGVVARRDMALGAQYGDEAATELTAFPVRLRKGGELPPRAQLQGWFSAEGKAVRVSAVEAGPARLMVVRAPGAANRLGGWRDIPQRQYGLPRGSRVRFLETIAHSFSAAGSDVGFDLFDGSGDFDAAEYGIPWLLSRLVHPLGSQKARIADAVAVAGVQVDEGAGPRAVLLMLDAGTTRDESYYTGPVVRRYLAALRVPLLVWSPRRPSDAARAAWGVVEDVSTPNGLERAFTLLKETLGAQRVVLVEGRYLPQSISLSSSASELLAPP